MRGLVATHLMSGLNVLVRLMHLPEHISRLLLEPGKGSLLKRTYMHCSSIRHLMDGADSRINGEKVLGGLDLWFPWFYVGPRKTLI